MWPVFPRSGGSNPAYGRDPGPAPPGFEPFSGPPHHPTMVSSFPVGQPVYPNMAWNCPVPASAPANISSFNLGGTNRNPTWTAPPADPDMPAANMVNSRGGMGCEPGYNYFFPAEHTKVVVLKSSIPPWQLPPNFDVPFHCAHVPTTVTVKELMKGFGANNPKSRMNVVCEVVQGGSGTWYKGCEFDGSNKDIMRSPIKDVGWDKTRTGLPNGKPVVFLWLRK